MKEKGCQNNFNLKISEVQKRNIVTEFKRKINMEVKLGEHSKLTAHPSERDQIRKFYQNVLGCPASKNSEEIDVFKIGDAFYLGVVYNDLALNKDNYLKSIWLELCTDNPEELKNKILEFGVEEIEYWDKEHFYFQAPGGQVFRLAKY